MYSYLTELAQGKTKNNKTAKGVKKNVIKSKRERARESKAKKI